MIDERRPYSPATLIRQLDAIQEYPLGLRVRDIARALRRLAREGDTQGMIDLHAAYSGLFERLSGTPAEEIRAKTYRFLEYMAVGVDTFRTDRKGVTSIRYQAAELAIRKGIIPPGPTLRFFQEATGFRSITPPAKRR